MTMDTITGLLAALCAALGAAGGYLARARQSARADGGLHAEVKYIARGVDELRVEQRVQGRELAAQGQRLARLEEAAKIKPPMPTEGERGEEYVS